MLIAHKLSKINKKKKTTNELKLGNQVILSGEMKLRKTTKEQYIKPV